MFQKRKFSIFQNEFSHPPKYPPGKTNFMKLWQPYTFFIFYNFIVVYFEHKIQEELN
jgi:hypothetical protein